MNIITKAKNVISRVIGFIKRTEKEIKLSAALKASAGIQGGYTPESLKKFYDSAKALI